MEIKFKVRISQFICLLGSVLLLLEAARQISLTLTITGLLLAVGGTLLLVISLAHELFSLSWFRTQVMLGIAILMCGLILIAPQLHLMWLWGFAVLLLYPRPRWLAPISATIGIFTTWCALAPLGSEWLSLGIGITASLMALGAIAGQRQLQVWKQLERRGRRDTHRALWTQYQLQTDLPREIARADREAIHIELLLLAPVEQNRPMRRRLISTLDNAAFAHETRYQLNDDTLALLLVARNEEVANLRRRQLAEHLAMPVRIRAQPLNGSDAALIDLPTLTKGLSAESATITRLPARPSGMPPAAPCDASGEDGVAQPAESASDEHDTRATQESDALATHAASLSPAFHKRAYERRQLANRKTLIFLLAALVMATYALWRYLIGDFDHILTPVLATVLLGIATGLNLLDDEQPLPAYLVLIAGYLMLSLEAPNSQMGQSLWLGLPAILTLLLLPLAPAMLLNLLLAPLWLWLLGEHDTTFGEALRYVCLLLVASQPFVINSLQAGVMALTASEETECNAFNSRSGQERLVSEAARARALDQPLSILVVHLPQLEMLQEQFGEDRRNECLSTACDVMQGVSRVGDLLCRHDTSCFWLLLPNTGEPGALIMRERLTNELSAATQPETGAIIAYARLVTFRADDTLPKLEQRLLAAQLALMDLNE